MPRPNTGPRSYYHSFHFVSPRPVFGVYAPASRRTDSFQVRSPSLRSSHRLPSHGFAVTRDFLSQFVRRFVERMAASGGGRTHLKIYLINGSIRSIKCTDRVEMQVRGPPLFFLSPWQPEAFSPFLALRALGHRSIGRVAHQCRRECRREALRYSNDSRRKRRSLLARF